MIEGMLNPPRQITQTKFGHHQGNCFAACIACLFPVDLADVPDFYDEAGDQWWHVFYGWMLGRFGIEPSMSGQNSAVQTPGQPYLIGGLAERGLMHSVVGLDGVMIWDPHPTHAGLLEVHDYTWFYLAESRRG